MRTEERLFSAFDVIAATSGIGHLRQDLLPQDIYFYYSKPYLILYRRDVPVPIGGIIHGARDLAAPMQDRLF
jgi:plasmid stabilization system protein ParE